MVRSGPVRNNQTMVFSTNRWHKRPMDTTMSSPGFEFLGESEPVQVFLDDLARAAAVERPVLLVGERGTGKELAAARLHYLSPRWRHPFMALNCAALAPNLVEDELFGHEPGAFTGALKRRQGRFEAAHGGTLFLDEIGALALSAQEKMLRVVEYGLLQRLGASSETRVDVRVVGAANVDLPRLADQGRFKRDLLDRLAFVVLTLPPLRARGEDVELLARHFARRFALEMGRDEPDFAPSALARLLAHDWPGNVRELKNVVERAVFSAGRDLVEEVVFDPFASPWRLGGLDEACRERESAGDRTDAIDLSRPLPEQVEDLKVSLAREALARARHNRRAAAGMLGLTYDQFRALLRRHAARILA